MTNAIKANGQSGKSDTESEVIRDGMAGGRAIEKWLHHQVGPAYDALKADPSRAVTSDQVRACLAAEHAKRQESQKEPKK